MREKETGQSRRWMRRVVSHLTSVFLLVTNLRRYRCDKSPHQASPLSLSLCTHLQTIARNTDKYFNKLNIAQTVMRKCYYDREDDPIDHL